MKLSERKILVKRVYWLEDLHRIGSEIGIDEIKNVKNYWELNHDTAAYLVAARLNDESITRLLEQNRPKYVPFGGFQGQFYSLDEHGNFTISSSWDKVARNVKKALDRWNEKAYGIIQALLNKNGESTYIDLINEIENVLGREYLPAALLPRLQYLKLVFKAGSNKYPYWAIPTEILPIIKEGISGFKLKEVHHVEKVRTKPTRMTRRQERKVLARDAKLDGIVANLVAVKSDINIIFHDKFGCRFFRDNEQAIIQLMKPCSDGDDFTSRVHWLSVAINEDVEESELRQILNVSGDFVATNFIPALLNAYRIAFDQPALMANLRMLKILRNKKYPAHPDDGQFLDAVRHFGQDFPPDWTVLWETVLKKVIESLTVFRHSLSSIPKNSKLT